MTMQRILPDSVSMVVRSSSTPTAATFTERKATSGLVLKQSLVLATALGLFWFSSTASCEDTSVEGNTEAGGPSTAGWEHPLVKKGKLDSPLVEVTPFVFKNRFYLLENWQKQWEFPGSPNGSRLQEDEVRIRDVKADRIVSVALVGRGLGMAFVWQDRVYVFAGNWGTNKKWNINEIEMTSSEDLVHWTEPVVVLKAEPQEKFFNVSVCRGKDKFALLVESNDPAWPAFTFKYFVSDDLLKWTRVPDAVYGRDKYVGGPALYFEDNTYYTLYLHALGGGRYETRITRSSDLVDWQDAPQGRPVVTFNPKNKVHPLRPANIRETNASDVEVCQWQGKTLVYFTGGDQHLAGDLQLAEFAGTPAELFKRFYAEPGPVIPTSRHKLRSLVLQPQRDKPEAFDSHAVECPMVFRYGDRWYMAYSAIRLTDGKSDSTIGLADSKDLVHWTNRRRILPRGDPGEFDHGGISGPFVWQEGKRLYMTYAGFPRLGYEARPGKHGLAWSDDLQTWTKSPHNPIHGPGTKGTWNDNIVYKTFVMKHEGKYWMFYNAHGSRGNCEQIGLATSTDLVHWTEHPDNPLLRKGDPVKDRDHVIIADPWIMKSKDRYHLFYFAFDGKHARECLATSTDLLHWSKWPGNPVMDVGRRGTYDSLHCHKPCIVEADGVYYHFYTACEIRPDGKEYRAIALATSEELPGVAYRKEADSAGKPLTIEQARVCVTGADHNRPDPFPGLGDFIGWPGGIERMPNGDLLVGHSAGYWHSSFAQPRQIEPARRKSWLESGWPLDFPAPTGGRAMACRSTDNGKTWSEPVTIVDHRLDDGPHAIFTCRDGTVLCFVGVQASWYGYEKAPEAFEKDIDGLNTKQFVLRSTDSGKTWSKPIWLDSPGDFYERAHGGRPIQLDDGGILWATYYQVAGEEYLSGAIRRSDDSGKTWEVISRIKRKDNSIDEPAIAELKDGRLILVTRPDGAVFHSQDKGVTWKDSGTRVVSKGKFKAPQLIVLKDGTLVAVATCSNLRVWISTDSGKTWSKDIPLDTSSYGYPGSYVLGEDESILLPYCASGRAPNRVYLVRFRVNQARDGIELMPVVE